MKGIIKQVLLATCVIGAPTCVFAYPFNPNPQSFQNYMNTVKWENGSKVYFQNMGNCWENTINPHNHYYNCKGFATITNPTGTKVCEVSVSFYKTGDAGFKKKECRYK
jgi:hypothetical protein